MIIGMVFLGHRARGRVPAARRPTRATAYDLPPFQGRATELGYYKARRATRDDFERAKALLEDGHRAMAALGIKEGLKKYPSARRLMRSIDEGKTYVVVSTPESEAADEAASSDAERIIGMFALNPQGDPAYAHMTGARWVTESSSPDNPAYAALHWVTVAADARRRGVGGYILGTAERIAKDDGKISVCCDIYEDNVPMRELLLSYGYEFCGNVEIHSRLGRVKRRAVFERAW